MLWRLPPLYRRAAQENRNSSTSRLLLLTVISSSKEKKGRLHFTLPSQLNNHSASTITKSWPHNLEMFKRATVLTCLSLPGNLVLWRSGNVNPLLMLSLEYYLTVTLPLSRSSNLDKVSKRNIKTRLYCNRRCNANFQMTVGQTISGLLIYTVFYVLKTELARYSARTHYLKCTVFTTERIFASIRLHCGIILHYQQHTVWNLHLYIKRTITLQTSIKMVSPVSCNKKYAV